MKVRTTVCERGVSGRLFDDIIIEFLAETFQKKTGKDVRKNIKAVLKLQAAAEKAKKTLSPAGVNEVNISVECLADDIDLNALLTRKEFEDRAADLVGRLRAPVEKALQEAGLTAAQLAEIEIVGGTSRVNIIKRTLGEILQLDPSALNYGLKTTMNADEASARGGALQCAMLSSRVKVKPFNIVDRLPYGIVASFEGAAAEGEGSASEGKVTSVSMYSRNDEVPHKPRRLTFRNKTADFTITLSYDDAAAAILPEGESRFLSRFTIVIPPAIASTAGAGDVRVTWNLDKHGFVYVQSAQLMEEIPYTAEELEAAAASEGKEAKEGETKIDPTKKRFKKTDLQVVVETPGLSPAEVKAALELEAQMAFEDKLITETADKRNELESYIYSMRDKLDGLLAKYGSAAEKEQLKGLLTVAEDWLYGDGFDSTKQQYTREIEKLRAVGDLLEKRLSEAEARPAAIEGLKKQLELCKSFASKYGEDYAHIQEEDRDALRKEVRNTEDWMYDQISQQGSLPAHVEPLLTTDTINVKRNALFKFSNPIMTKPKPKAETPVTPPPATESKDSEPMDQAKGGPEEK